MEAIKEETPFVHTKENSKGITWKASTPLPGQNVFLMSYAVNPGGKEGIYAAVKVIGIYPDEETAEKVSIEESKVDFNKQYKLGVVGKWDLIKDPICLRADQLDKITDIKGKDGEMVRKIIATQNVLIKKQEDKDKKEMKEREEKILSEMAEDNEDDDEDDDNKSEAKKEKERYIRYKILKEKVKQNPLFVESAKGQIEELVKEIKRVEEKNIKAIEELTTLTEEYPALELRYIKDEEKRRKKKEDELKKRMAKK